MKLIRTLAAGALTGLLLIGCSGDGDDADDTGEAAVPAEAGGDAEIDVSAAGEEPADADAADEATITGAANIDPSPRHVIHNIDLVIETDDVVRAAARAVALAESAGGFVSHEITEGSDSATLTLRIPSARHSTVVGDLEALGEVQHRSRSAEDVTAEVVDVEARIASQRRSIERIRELLDQASNITDVVRIESELGTREADLDSLLRRQEQLASLTSLATVTVTFYVTDEAPDAQPAALGFTSGLDSGWDAFVATVRVAGTAVGALLPFAAAVALVGLPGWLVWRRRRPAPQSSTPAAP